ncbi:MAG TPA: hypothetical protein VFK02_24925 [Kofleriaceae bacterium]|nr:hypothetical protein [Kofleriaceae bacterium]
MRARLLIAVVSLAPCAARADGLLDEVATGATPGSRWFSDKLAGLWDLDGRWHLRAELSITQVGTSDKDSRPGDVFVGTLSASYAASDHWSLRLSAAGSPRATTHTIVEVDDPSAPPGGQPASGRERAIASSYTLGVGVDYDQASSDVHSWSGSLSLSATHFDAQQGLIGVRDPDGGMLDGAQVAARCTSAPGDPAPDPWCRQDASLSQLALGATLGDTVDGTTDLSLDVSVYAFTPEPSDARYLGFATINPANLGAAVGAPPVRAAVTPGVGHRWDTLSTSASLSIAYPLNPAESGLSVSSTVQIERTLAVSETRQLRVYASMMRGVVPAGTGSFGLGAQFTW